MLKRRRRIQKYISALKGKRRNIKEEVERLKLEQPQGSEAQAEQRLQVIRGGVSIPRLTFGGEQEMEEEKAVWSDKEQNIHLPNKNMFRKLQLNDEVPEKEYEERLRRFYNQRYGMTNWATEGQGQEEKDLQDMLNEEQIYTQKRKGQDTKVQFVGRTTYHHDSVINGLAFKGSVVASCGLDQKLKLWSIDPSESNPELRIKLQKDVYAEKYPLTGCLFRGNDIVLSTMRQNYLVVDSNKWQIKRVSSSFLNDHPKFSNIRASIDQSSLAMFSESRISLLDEKNSFQGSLIAGQPLNDVQFGKDKTIYGVSNDCLFEWDLRMWRLVNCRRDCLAYTKLWTNGDSMAIGSKLGVVRLSSISAEGVKQYAELSNLVTHVTGLESNPSGSILAAGSRWKGNAVRLVDLQKGRTIPGWPTVSTRFGMASSLAVSGGNQLCVGNSHGYLAFYSLKQSQ